MSNVRTIHSFFKRKERVDDISNSPCHNHEGQVRKVSRIEHDGPNTVAAFVRDPDMPSTSVAAFFCDQEMPNADVAALVRDPGMRPQICEYPINQRDEIRRAYIKFGPYQPIQLQYPSSGQANHLRRFQPRWFKSFSWLEYSVDKDAAFCFPCYLFGKQEYNVFTVRGFRNWKKVNCGKDCAFLCHIGKHPNSGHNNSVKCLEEMQQESCHIERVIERHTTQQISNNRMRLKASIDVIRWLTFQACAFRGHDEQPNSRNRGNFLEMIEFLASYNEQVKDVVRNAPQNAKYTSPAIQKEILHVFAMNVQIAICKEIGSAKFCIIVDEARDEARREQMAIVVRFVDEVGIVRERFLDLVHVKDTNALTLKNEISSCLSHHNLSIQNIRGQGYDGASNMRGEWNGLQALFLSDCPYAYYVHCLAHRLQLALVAAAREVVEVHTFFQNLNFIVNIVCASSKRNDQLHIAHASEIAHLIAIEELDTGSGANQIGNLQRPGDTRWSSHFNSLCSLFRMFGATCTVLESIAIDGSSYSQRGDATYALKQVLSFDFVFVLHLMKEIMGITDLLCHALQQKSQDILNAMHLVSTTKSLIQKLRDEGWESLLNKVTLFCNTHNIQVPNMNDYFCDVVRARRRKDKVTVQHHFRINIFTVAIDHQLQELNSRFSEKATELLTLSSALDPRDGYKLFKVDHICNLAEKFYPIDFSEQEREQLRYELLHYGEDVPHHPKLQDLSTISELCQGLVKTGKSKIYPLIDRLIRIVLTLPVSTATTERAFSAMKIVKTRLRSKMEDDFLKDYLLMYIEKEIAESFTTDMIIDDFYSMKHRRAQLMI